MAIASIGNIGAIGNESSAASIDMTSLVDVAEAGRVLLVSVALDNTGTSDGNNNEISGAQDTKGNSWSKLHEWTKSNGAPADALTVGLLYTRVTTQLETSDTITVNFANTVVAKAVSAWKFSVASALEVVAVNQNVNSGNSWGSLSISGLANREYLFFRVCGKESGTNTALTPTANYSSIQHRRSGPSGASSVYVDAEFRIVTATEETSDPTLIASADSASVMVALAEVTGEQAIARKVMHYMRQRRGI